MEIVNPLSHHHLLEMYKDVAHPEQKIKYLKQKGLLKPLMKGWYLFEPKKFPYSNFHIANLLYGPSYVTGLSALSYLGWIPERTTTVYSAVKKRGKNLDTSIGSFVYKSVKKEVFHIGIQSMTINQDVRVLIGSPAKSLYDHLVFTPNLHFTGKKDLQTYLEEDLRFDTERLSQLSLSDLDLLEKKGQKTRQISLLYNLVKDLQ